MIRSAIATTFLLSACLSVGQASNSAPGTDNVQANWIRKDHTITLGGRKLDYVSTVGSLPIRDPRDLKSEILGSISFTAYRLKGGGTDRPVTFVFNGGPGSASLWLHLGFVGPKRVVLQPEGFMPAPPYRLVPNDESLLPTTDLVMIDPVGTGYSRASKEENNKRFFGVHEDIETVGEFIRMYLTEEGRWLSPVFLLGESYGGVRGSGVADWLTQNGVGLNGVILVSAYLNGSVQDPAKANDQPFAFYLPSYAAAAWYHKKLAPDLQAKPVSDLVSEVQNWVYDEYMPALLRGDSLSPEAHQRTLEKLARYTGLSSTFLEDSNLRIRDYEWFKELLRKDRYTVGRYDARFKGLDRLWVSESPDYDPSYSQVGPAFVSTMNDYLRNELGFKTTQKYFVLGEGLTGWKMDEGAPIDQSEALRRAMHQNPYTKLFVAMGYYDFACPLGTVEQVLNQMELDPRLKGNITRGKYPAGHMMYLDTASRVQLHADVTKFIEMASHPTAPPHSVN